MYYFPFNETKISPYDGIQYNYTQIVNDWLLNDCIQKCEYGKCVLGKCICSYLKGGEFCNELLTQGKTMEIVSILVVILQTILFLIFGFIVWEIGLSKMVQNSIHSSYT